jgi:adenylate kinase family enzyme
MTMQRIAVIGNAGGGKSTLCTQLGQALDIPVHMIDKMQWKPGWVSEAPAIITQKHALLLEQERWIIDGWGPWETIEARFQAADTIIFIDLPLPIHYWWACKRQFMCLFRPRPDGPDGCPMLPMTGQLMKMIWHVHTSIRPRLLELLATVRAEKRVIDICSPRQLRHFMRAHGA